jgi:hypothetical protein
MTEAIDLRRATKDIRVMKGDTWTVEGRLKDSEGTPIDLTGATILAQLRKSSTSATSTALDAEITDAAGGIFTFGQEEAETGGVYDVQITMSGGSVRTYLGGQILVTQDVSRV